MTARCARKSGNRKITFIPSLLLHAAAQLSLPVVAPTVDSRMRAALLFLAGGALAAATSAATAQRADLHRPLAPSPTPATVLAAGAGGYAAFCSPGLASNAAAFIVTAEAVPTGGGVCGAAHTAGRDIVLARSTDSGQSYGPLQVVATVASVYGAGCADCSLSYPTPVGLAIDSNAPLLLMATAARSAAERDAGDLDILIWRSVDNGVTWSPIPVNLTDQLGGRPLPRLNGGHGIRIMNSKFAGRLVVPATVTYGGPAALAATTLISDDGGNTWRRGTGVTQSPKAGVMAEISWAMKGAAVFAPEPGNLVAFLQDDETPCSRGTPPTCRWLSYSVDGGDSWGFAVESVVDGGGAAGSISQWWGGRGLLTVNAHSVGGGNVTFAASQDGGSGGSGSEVFSLRGGSADVLNFIWLAIVESAVVAWEVVGGASGSIAAVVIDPSTLIG